MTDTFPSLSPQLQIAARHALDRPDDVALMSMRSLAASAGVHPSTMVRLARIYGYDSYTDFREMFQLRLRDRPAGYLARAKDLQARGAEGGKAELLMEVLSSNSNNLRNTFEGNDTRQFIACARALSKARKIYVVGLRSVYPVSFFFYYSCHMFRGNAVLLEGPGGTFADNLREFGPQDVIFAISFEPYTYETVRAVEYAKDRGGKAVVLTDSPVSPLAKNADHMLIIRNESPSFYHSISAAMATAEALISLLVAEGGDEALASIEESEKQLGSFDAYWHLKKPSKGQKVNSPRKKT
ncbi:MAG: MurR/RpiR family transcriptional regulator [Rhodospirillales bacterium]|nr:MurR/RpiR family transcriptional regulator [Rhodospirillales bacterium]